MHFKALDNVLIGVVAWRSVGAAVEVLSRGLIDHGWIMVDVVLVSFAHDGLDKFYDSEGDAAATAEDGEEEEDSDSGKDLFDVRERVHLEVYSDMN